MAITGASSGIGEATALKVVEAGGAVALAARRTERIEALAAKINDGGGRAIAVTTDVGDEAQAKAFVDATVAQLGRIDVLVNNAGVMLLGRVSGADTDEWRRMIDANLYGVIYATHAAVPHLLQQRSGHVVTVSSIAGVRASAGSAVYNATKFGVNAFSEALRQELAEHDVRVTTINPGAVETELRTHLSAELQRAAARALRRRRAAAGRRHRRRHRLRDLASRPTCRSTTSWSGRRDSSARSAPARRRAPARPRSRPARRVTSRQPGHDHSAASIAPSLDLQQPRPPEGDPRREAEADQAPRTTAARPAGSPAAARRTPTTPPPRRARRRTAIAPRMLSPPAPTTSSSRAAEVAAAHAAPARQRRARRSQRRRTRQRAPSGATTSVATRHLREAERVAVRIDHDRLAAAADRLRPSRPPRPAPPTRRSHPSRSSTNTVLLPPPAARRVNHDNDPARRRSTASSARRRAAPGRRARPNSAS